MCLNKSQNQNLNSWGLVLLKRVNLVPKYPFNCSTFLMFSNNLASTTFCVFFAYSLHFFSACFDYSTLLTLCSEAFFNSDWVHDLCFLKKASSTLAVIPSSGTLVDVEMTKAGFTLFNGTPLMAYGPVTKRFPDVKVLRTTTLLPLCLPERRMTTFPAWIDFLPADGFGAFLFLWWSLDSSSAGYHVLALFLNLFF